MTRTSTRCTTIQRAGWWSFKTTAVKTCRNDNAEWIFEPQGEIAESSRSRVAPVIAPEHTPEMVVLKSEAEFQLKLGGTTDSTAFVPNGMDAVFISREEQGANVFSLNIFHPP